MGLLDRFLAWLKAGWPQGIPEADVVPLLAVLRRRLSDEEIDELGRYLEAHGLLPVSRVGLGAAMLRLTDDIPTPAEIDRVSQRLMEGGWVVDALDN